MTPYIDALEKHKTVRAACAAVGVARSTFFDRLNKERSAQKYGLSPPAETSSVDMIHMQYSQRPLNVRINNTADVKRYIFTCAVQGAALHKDFLRNLETYAKYKGAQLVVGTLTSRGARLYEEAADDGEFPEELHEYMGSGPIAIDNKVRFCPELRLTPSMVKPLSGLQTYTKKLWGVFPHTKICAETVATHKNRPAKFNFTTGAVTQAFYSPTKAGFRAHFDHMLGALIVEVTKKGIYPRHVTPASGTDGTFYDLDVCVKDGKVTRYGRVPSIVYGDIHIEQIDNACAIATWGDPTRSLAGLLRPETQVFHDLMDMSAANYHELNDVFNRFGSWYHSRNVVALDFGCAWQFMELVANFSERNVVVDSNHDYFVKKWLLGFDPSKREDFENLEAYYTLKLATLSAMKEDKPFSFVEMSFHALFKNRPNLDELMEKFRFLKEDEGFEIKNVELSWHGHQGMNGSRGSRGQFKFVSDKSTIGHTHSPGIESGCHQVGTSSKLVLGYNKGASSWAHTHDIMYPHGGRTLITLSDGKFWPAQVCNAAGYPRTK